MSENLAEALKDQRVVQALPEKRMHIYREGKTSYVNLFEKEGRIYGSSIREEGVLILGKVIITNARMLGRETRKEDYIQITQKLPTSCIGEIVFH